MLKLNRGVTAVLSVVFFNAALVSTTWASVSDEVAVQLLERLSELELEVNNLRGENEILRRELLTIRSTQRTGFLEVDKRVSLLEKNREVRLPAPNDSNSQATMQVVPQANDTSATSGGSVTTVSPSPSQGTIVARSTPTVEATPVAEIVANTTVVNNEQATTPLVSEVVAAQRNALASGSTEQVATDKKAVSDNSDSYYYYGSQDKNETPTVGGVANKAKVIEDKPKALPSSHQAKAAYNQAYKQLVNDPVSAVPAFRDFMKNYPKHELIANAQYWLGEALYAQKDYSGATEEFMRVLKNFKGSPKAPGAALKLGYSFYELRQWDFARRTLEDTMRFFPETNAAKLAASRLERMTNEGK